MRPIPKQPTQVINYNSNSNSDSNNNAEFVDIDLPCNNLSLRLLANDIITCTKKRRVLKTEDKADEQPKVKATQRKKIPNKQVGKKSSKASVLISGVVGKRFLNVQTVFMNTNIIIPALHLFQISPKFQEKIKHLMTVF